MSKCGSSRPVLCLPRRGHNTLVVTLRDTCSPEPLLMHTLDTEAGGVLSFSDLCQCPRYGAFWSDASSRQLECVGHDTYHVSHDSASLTIEHIQLVIDLARARLFGWRATTAMRPRLWDLAHNGRALGIHWDILHEAERAEAATQTFPAHWHALASPVHSASLPTRRPALDCQVDERFYTAGTLFHLDCPTMGVYCTIPCTARQHVWALRLGDSVRGLCTDVVNWNVVTEVASIIVLGTYQVLSYTADMKSGSGLTTSHRWPVNAVMFFRGLRSPRAAMSLVTRSQSNLS